MHKIFEKQYFDRGAGIAIFPFLNNRTESVGWNEYSEIKEAEEIGTPGFLREERN